MQLKITNLKEEEIRQRKKLEFLSVETEEDQKEKNNMSAILQEKNETSQSLEKGKSIIENSLKQLRDDLEAKKPLRETLRSELTEKKVSHTAKKEKRDSILREKEKLSANLIDIDEKKSAMAKERIDIEDTIKHKKNEVVNKEKSLATFVVAIKGLQEESGKLKDILEAKTAALNLVEKQQKAKIEELSSVRQELSRTEVKKTELALKLNHLKDDIRKTYLVDLDNLDVNLFLSEPVLQEDEENLARLKEKLQEIGPVNLGTLEELEELKTRYDFLKKQQDDLLQSIESLQDTISRINNTTRSKLRNAFEALNEKFKEVFTILFGKGKAELILTEGSILEAGIDIVAQPPGKKLQNLMLLSGGEKALTAISLLFAGFMIKPTPLCLLDEVDAPTEGPWRFLTSFMALRWKNRGYQRLFQCRWQRWFSHFVRSVLCNTPRINY
jgi:chromosome segregation protein